MSAHEAEAMRVLGTLVPPGQRVLNDRGDGSAWMYAIAGVLPVAGHYNASQIGPDARLLSGSGSTEYATDPEVRAAVDRIGAQYVMLDRGFVRKELPARARVPLARPDALARPWSTATRTR